MATLPPYPFSPTSVPTYAPTTVVPPPPCGCGAPAYAPCCFSPAVAYPSTPFPGGYYTCPSPFVNSPPPTFPYAAAYPYQPPASGYTPTFPAPAPGFFPNWPPPPDPTPSTAPASHAVLARHAHEVPCIAEKKGSSFRLLSPNSIYQGDISTKVNTVGGEPIYNMQSPDEKFVGRHMGSSTLSGDKASPNKLQREILNIQARLDKQQACERTSFDTIQGELVKLTSMASQLNASIGNILSSAQTSKPQLSATPGSSSLGVTGTTSVTPKVFGEMPTPVSWLGTQSIAPNDSLIHNSDVSTLSEQNLDGRPQLYGLHNLNCNSVFRADGTEHSYFTLPTDYPLERVVLEPVFDVYDDQTDGCSSEFTDVFDSTPERQIYEDKQRENTQAPKCFSKPMVSPERPTDGIFIFTNGKKHETELFGVYLNNASDNAVSEEATYFTFPHGPLVRTDRSIRLTNEKGTQADPVLCVQEAIRHCHDEKSEINIKEQDDERACNFLVLKASGPFVTRSDQLSIEHSMRGFRLQWDPGAKTFSYLFVTAADATKLQFTSLDVWDPGIGIPSSMSHGLQSLTAGSEYPLPSLQPSEPATWLSQVNSACYAWDPGTTLLLYKSIWLLFTAEKEMVTPIPEQWSFWSIKYYRVALWLIHFLPP